MLEEVGGEGVGGRHFLRPREILHISEIQAGSIVMAEGGSPCDAQPNAEVASNHTTILHRTQARAGDLKFTPCVLHGTQEKLQTAAAPS